MHKNNAVRLRVQVLGLPTWRIADASDDQGAPVSGKLLGKFAVLVAMVATAGRQPRDAVVRRLWPGDLTKGRGSLRTTVLRLRALTGHAVFVQDDSIVLAEGVDSDVFEDIAAWPLPELIARSEFLAGAEFANLPLLQAWIGQQRQHWYARACEVLVQRAAELDAAGLAQAQQLAQRLTRVAPALEGGWRASMWLHFLAGDHTAAADAHEQLAARLGFSGGVESPQTQALWRVVKRGAAAAPAVSAVAAAADLQPGLRHPPVLVGRQGQWTAMTDAWSGGRVFLLQGEGGIGKTRLLNDFLRHEGAAVVVSAISGDGDAPYATLATLLRALINQQALDLDRTPRLALASVLPELARSGDAAPADHLAICRAAEAVLEQAAESGVRAVALDNLHHADLASLEAWRRLASGPARHLLHFACAARALVAGVQHDAVTDWLGDSQPLMLIELLPWTHAEVAALLPTLDLVKGPASITAEQLHAWVGGNPFYVLETLRELARRPADRVDPTLPKPTGALPLLQRHLRRVPQHALPLLQLGAVMGPDVVAAAHALAVPAAEVAAMADALEARGILRDGRFVHDLLRETTLNSLTAPQRLHWHAVAAEALARDARVPRARIAGHWHAAQSWAEAAQAFRAAGIAARDSGRLEEACALLRQAGADAARAHDPALEFDASFDSLEAEIHLRGVEGAQALVERLAALAATPRQAAALAYARASVARAKYARGNESLLLAAQAVTATAPFADLHLDALAMHAIAMAQAGQHAEAIERGKRALALARTQGLDHKARDFATNLVYIHYEAARVYDAIVIARRLVDDFVAAGDEAGAVSVQCNLAGLLFVAGDTSSVITPALAAHLRHRRDAVPADSPMAAMNRVGLGSALAHAGRVEEALSVLCEAGGAACKGSHIGARAKSQLALVNVYLLLGDDERAFDTLDSDDIDWHASMQIQRAWALARIATLRGQDTQPFLHRIGRIQGEQWQTPVVHSPWLEWSRQGDAQAVAEQMATVQSVYSQAGMVGTARSAALRRLDRLNELATPGAVVEAAALARTLRPHVSGALHASTYLPEAWCIVAQSLRRDGDADAADDCERLARAWIKQTALPNVPPASRAGFLQRNPVNRRLLGPHP